MKAKERMVSRESTPTKASSRVTGETTMKSRCKEELVLKVDNTCPVKISRDEYDHLDKVHRCICDAAVKEGDFVIVDISGVKFND